MKKLNIVFGALLIGVCAFFFWYAGSFKALSGQKDIGPSAFPRFVCVLLVICGIMVIAREIRRNSGEAVSLFNKKFFIGIVSILVYGLMLKYLGFILDSVLIVGIMMLMLLNEPLKKAWPIIALVSVAAPAALYLIFGVFLKVPLPNGILTPFLG